MAVVSTEAFVLRSYKLGEQDKIVVLFTKDFGKIRLVAKGARRTKSRFGASLEIFTHLRAIFHQKENRDLLVLDRAEILYSLFEKQTVLRTNLYLFYFAELVHEFFPDGEKNPAAFRILLNVERSVRNQQNLDYLARYVELQLLRSQGILSSVLFCARCNRSFGSLQERRYLGAAGTEFFCNRCRDAESLLLSAAVVRSIDLFQQGAVDWAAKLGPSVVEEMASLNRLMITRFLGKELQSYRLRKDLRF